MLTTGQWLKFASEELTKAGIGTARLDCLILLEDRLDKDRASLIAHPETRLTSRQEKELNAQIQRRATHEPLAYIRGFSEFYGRNFMVDERVLEPRPESENFITLLKELASDAKLTVLDIGTGSGALAITLKLELPSLDVYAVDIDEGCLDIARVNAKKLNSKITIISSDLLRSFPTSKKIDIIVANLPYVPDKFTINPAALREPKTAIFGGEDGLDLYRELFRQIDKLESKPAKILTESLPPQHQKLLDIAKSINYHLVRTEDFIQCFELG